MTSEITWLNAKDGNPAESGQYLVKWRYNTPGSEAKKPKVAALYWNVNAATWYDLLSSQLVLQWAFLPDDDRERGPLAPKPRRRQIVAYTGTNAISLTELAKNVARLLALGWQPYKGHTATPVPDGRGVKILYSQALVKRNA